MIIDCEHHIVECKCREEQAMREVSPRLLYSKDKKKMSRRKQPMPRHVADSDGEENWTGNRAET